jgi:hypothetical protein
MFSLLLDWNAEMAIIGMALREFPRAPCSVTFPGASAAIR